MNIAIQALLYCECGYAMLRFGHAHCDKPQTIGCSNPNCKNHAKRFKLPSLTLVEIVKEHDSSDKGLNVN